MDKSARKNTQGCVKIPPTLSGIDPQVWCRLFRRSHPVKTAEGVAADLGASPRTVGNWMSGVSTPSLAWFMRILAFYGPEVLAEFLPESCGWLSVAMRAERQAALEEAHARIARELNRLEGAIS